MKINSIYIAQIIFYTTSFISCNTQQEPRYDENTAFMLGRIYYLASPYMVKTNPSQGTEYVQVNSQYFGEDGEIIRCARDLGNNLIRLGLMNFSTQQERDDAYESALNMGATMDQAREATAGIDQAALDAVLMGQELIWLSEVLPSAAQGDWTLFNTTGSETRRAFYQAWPMLQTFASIEPGMQEMVNEIFEKVMSQYEDYVVYQIAIMAMNIRD